MESVFNGGITPPFISPLTPFHSVNIQPSNACPRNFVIFDQTTDKTHIMFHPNLNSKFFGSCFGVDTICQENIDRKDESHEIKPTSFSEDSDDIDALLNTEDDQAEEYDDDEMSTARTDALRGCSSPDSCCNYYESPSGKSGSHFRSLRCNDDKKRKQIKKTVKALRRIIPGASGLSTAAVLDEAVWYLKSLGMEVKKLGVGNSKV